MQAANVLSRREYNYDFVDLFLSFLWWSPEKYILYFIFHASFQ